MTVPVSLATMIPVRKMQLRLEEMWDLVLRDERPGPERRAEIRERLVSIQEQAAIALQRFDRDTEG